MRKRWGGCVRLAWQAYQWELASGLEGLLPEQFAGLTDHIRGALKPWKQVRPARA